MNSNIDLWRTFDPKTSEEIDLLDPKSLEDAFYTSLKFGTGGLRGLMGVGPNRINLHTISFTTQGLANYLKQQFHEPLKVFIGYDTRHNSYEFALQAAKVLSGNGIEALLNDQVCPSPFVSFCCRHHACHAAIMITASHNPASYNGYKIYWQDGGQILPLHDIGILKEIQKITHPNLVKTSSSLIQTIGRDSKDAYLKCAKTLQLCKDVKKDLKIVFTNLHGTGIVLTPPLLNAWGYFDITYVGAQKEFDGSFPTVSVPNPELESALDLGIQTLKEIDGDLLIAQDPDADRMRAAIKVGESIVILNGNQLACLLLSHIVTHLKPLPSNGACIKTIVTSELFRKIAEDHGLACFDVLTGFKYISQLIETFQTTKTHQYVFGGEESYGTLFGTYSRDKDAVIAAALIAEMANVAKNNGNTLLDLLNDLYKKYGFHTEYHASLDFPETKAGREEMEAWLKNVRHLETPTHDYLNMPGFPKSDVLEFRKEDGTKLVIRPSGTEPKIKIYAESSDKSLCEKHVLEIITKHQLNRPR